VEKIGLDHLDSPHRQRPRSVAGRIAAGNAHGKLARAQERVHNATALLTRTTEYRYDLLGHHRLLVPCSARRPGPHFSDQKTILPIYVQGHILRPEAVPRVAKDQIGGEARGAPGTGSASRASLELVSTMAMRHLMRLVPPRRA